MRKATQYDLNTRVEEIKAIIEFLMEDDAEAIFMTYHNVCNKGLSSYSDSELFELYQSYRGEHNGYCRS